MQTGDRIRLRIEGIAFGGSGVGRVDGFVVFVPFTVTGEEVEAEIGVVRKRYARGVLQRILVPSPHRREPLCPSFGICGGCQLQHVSYDHQLQVKKSQVREIFQHLGKCAPLVLKDILPSPKQFHYRGKAEFHTAVRGGKVTAVGFIDISGKDVVDIVYCHILEKSINCAYRDFRNRQYGSGGMGSPKRHVIWSSPEGPQGAPGVPEDRPPSSRIGRTVNGRCLAVSPGGFFQVNASLVEDLVDQVVAFSSLEGRETVIDGYCGVGLFCLFLSPRAKEVICIERDGRALKRARRHLGEAGFRNCGFLQGDMGDLLQEKIIGRKKPVDVVVLDPPRGGLGQKVLEALSIMRPARIVYVSCNPPTQARDIRFLVQAGFTLACLQPLDMFPQTGHIEVIALLCPG